MAKTRLINTIWTAVSRVLSQFFIDCHISNLINHFFKWLFLRTFRVCIFKPWESAYVVHSENRYASVDSEPWPNMAVTTQSATLRRIVDISLLIRHYQVTGEEVITCCIYMLHPGPFFCYLKTLTKTTWVLSNHCLPPPLFPWEPNQSSMAKHTYHLAPLRQVWNFWKAYKILLKQNWWRLWMYSWFRRSQRWDWSCTGAGYGKAILPWGTSEASGTKIWGLENRSCRGNLGICGFPESITSLKNTAETYLQHYCLR